MESERSVFLEDMSAKWAVLFGMSELDSWRCRSLTLSASLCLRCSVCISLSASLCVSGLCVSGLSVIVCVCLCELCSMSDSDLRAVFACVCLCSPCSLSTPCSVYTYVLYNKRHPLYIVYLIVNYSYY